MTGDREIVPDWAKLGVEQNQRVERARAELAAQESRAKRKAEPKFELTEEVVQRMATFHSQQAVEARQERFRASIVAAAETQGHFDYLDDGYVYYFGSGKAISANVLRILADELDRRNEAWDAQVREGLARAVNVESFNLDEEIDRGSKST